MISLWHALVIPSCICRYYCKCGQNPSRLDCEERHLPPAWGLSLYAKVEGITSKVARSIERGWQDFRFLSGSHGLFRVASEDMTTEENQVHGDAPVSGVLFEGHLVGKSVHTRWYQRLWYTQNVGVPVRYSCTSPAVSMVHDLFPWIFAGGITINGIGDHQQLRVWPIASHWHTIHLAVWSYRYEHRVSFDSWNTFIRTC